jgi:thiol-disulfide isomerase/thioredoxin
MKYLFLLLSINLLTAILCVNSKAQININLTLDKTMKASTGRTLFCDQKYKCGLAQSEQSKTSDFGEEKIQMKIWRTGKDFYLLIDSNLNNKLTDNKKILLKNRSDVSIELKRKSENGKISELPYKISHEPVEKDGLVTDRFSIFMDYSATGVLSYKDCISKIRLSDMNFDGSFGLIDADSGTNLAIDINNDGKFWGREEYRKTSEIIEFCGQNFLVTAFSHSLLTLVPTDLQIAEVNKRVSSFAFTLLNNETVTSDKLKGKCYILDFWASWCVPCVVNLPQVASLEREYKNELSVFSINVDALSQKGIAEKIIGEKQLTDFSAIRGMGEDDSLWKTFGGANLNSFSIPLYVLVDKDGTVRYLGSGGADLKELKENIKKVLLNKK